MWIGKFDLDGNLVWQKTVGDEGGESANAIAECPDGNLVVAGTGSTHEEDDYDMVVMKMDPDGNALWQKMIGGSGYEEARSVAVTSDGGLVVAGSSSDDEASSPDVLVAKLGADGRFHGTCSLVRDAPFTSDTRALLTRHDPAVIL